MYDPIDKIIKCMASGARMYDIQKIQTAHRFKLAEFWGIKAGMRILEIGCGQGDTTAVLAYFVGENGFVHGIDIASEHYGSPITLGASADYLRKSELGKQIKIDFETDLLSDDIDFSGGPFDTIVFSHCSWYLKSFEELQKLLEKARDWGKQLCFAEWDPRVYSIEQYPHFLAALVQAQYECFRSSSDSNVRTLFTPKDLKNIAEIAGWLITEEQIIASAGLQDGHWEVSNAIRHQLLEFDNLPGKLKRLIRSEIDLLSEISDGNQIGSLSTYAFVGV